MVDIYIEEDSSDTMALTCNISDMARKSDYWTTKYDLLRSLVMDNIEHFRENNGKFSERFLEIFSRFLDDFSAIEAEIKDLADIVHLYDFDANTPGNGYRSIIAIVDTFVELSIGLCQGLIAKRRNVFFPYKRHLKELGTFTRLLAGLLALIKIFQKIRSENEPGELFHQYDVDSFHNILMDMEAIDRTCFYESLNAFQFDDSLHKSLRFICLMTASYSHVYYASGGKFPRLLSALMNFCRYSRSSSKLSKRFVKVSLHSAVDFCKTFWNLHGFDFIEKFSKTVADPMAINKRLTLLPEPLQLINGDGVLVDIPIPSAHNPISSIMCRLVSASIRDGQLDNAERLNHLQEAVKAASPYLIIHIHGSGYVSVSSTVQIVYMNEWAMKLDAPILSICHSLAPEAPYPRPLEECLYAYAWAVKNCRRLGSTGEKICLIGFSAGADLATSLIFRTIQLGIRRPDGFLGVCPGNMTHFLPSPSVLMLLMDPLMPLEFVLACFEAYIGDPGHSEGRFANRSMSEAQKLDVRVDEINKRAGNDPLKSPFLASDNILAQFPPTRFMSAHRDPFVDNLVMFLRRMKALGKDVRLGIVGNLPHGFLNFSLVCQPAHDGSKLCIQWVRELLQMAAS